MDKAKRKPELNVDQIGGEPLTKTEKEQLKAFFREQLDQPRFNLPRGRDDPRNHEGND